MTVIKCKNNSVLQQVVFKLEKMPTEIHINVEKMRYYEFFWSMDIKYSYYIPILYCQYFFNSKSKPSHHYIHWIQKKNQFNVRLLWSRWWKIVKKKRTRNKKPEKLFFCRRDPHWWSRLSSFVHRHCGGIVQKKRIFVYKSQPFSFEIHSADSLKPVSK